MPEFVKRTCAAARATSPVQLVCPPLVPVTKYRTFPGASGVLLGNTNIPPVKPPAPRIYLLGFNGGDTGPTYWHWIAGIGTPEAIQYWVLSDARNEVRGTPKRVAVITADGRKVDIWQFPDHPAGGQLGGHFAAITSAGSLRAIASIHGDNARQSAQMAVALARRATSRPATARTPRALRPRENLVPVPAFMVGHDTASQQRQQPQVPLHREHRSGTAHGRGPRPCLPGIAKQLPENAVLAYLREALGTDRIASLPRMQPRPRSFRLPNRTDNSLPCFGQGGRWVPFRASRRAFYLGLYIGPKASPASVRELGRLVDGIRIGSR